MVKKYGWEPLLALGFISLGFVLIGVGWNGSASYDTPEQQIPFILSGGIGGLGLIGLGAGLLLFLAGRRMLERMEAKYDAVIEAIRGTGGPSEEAAAANGHAVPTVVADGLVVIGRSSFHRPDCRLVEGKGQMDAVSPDEAVARGLSPCRVCEPTKVRARTKRR